jgi:hypothetical protein
MFYYSVSKNNDAQIINPPVAPSGFMCSDVLISSKIAVEISHALLQALNAQSAS